MQPVTSRSLNGAKPLVPRQREPSDESGGTTTRLNERFGVLGSGLVKPRQTTGSPYGELQNKGGAR